ncbi:MAG TPA: HEAT repeat domain-containing protein [Bryobacteraceae bacterium]|nr:HEAT repeat domain-containing protein [Bryobacteraceae bacterium]
MLSAQPGSTAWDVLSAGVSTNNPDHRKEALAALSAVGPSPQAVKALENALANDKESDVRQTAAAALGEMKATASIPALKAALDDPSGEVAFSAAKALWDLGDPSGKATFQEILMRERKDSKSFVGGALGDAKRTMHDPKKLAMMGVKEASGALLGPYSMGFTVAKDAMKDSGAPGRALAAQYLSKDCDARAVQLLEWSLKDDTSWLVKAAAARGLGKCGDEAAIPVLETHLSSSHEALRFQAAAAIVRLSARTQPAADTANAAPPKAP